MPHYLEDIAPLHPASKDFDWMKGISKETLYDPSLTLRSKIRIGLGISDWEAGYPGSEALFVDEEEFDQIYGQGKFKEILEHWTSVSDGIGDGEC